LTILFEKKFNGILIRAQEGTEFPKLKDGVLTISGYRTNYDSFRTVDVYLDKKIIQLGIAECYGQEYQYRSHYYVMDYGVYNLRRYDDMSVIKNLEKIGPKILTKKERHSIEMVFGSTKKGKQDLAEFLEKVKNNFETTSYEQPVRLRNWDQTNEILINPQKTKANFMVSTHMIGELANLVETNGFAEEAKKIKSNRAKAVFEKINCSVDLSHHFKKTKK